MPTEKQRRLQLADLQTEYDTLSQQISRVRKDLVIETDTLTKFKLMKDWPQAIHCYPPANMKVGHSRPRPCRRTGRNWGVNKERALCAFVQLNSKTRCNL